MSEFDIVLRVLGEKIKMLETEIYIKNLEIEKLKKELEEAHNE